jgi:hypothetical protein
MTQTEWHEAATRALIEQIERREKRVRKDGAQ